MTLLKRHPPYAQGLCRLQLSPPFLVEEKSKRVRAEMANLLIHPMLNNSRGLQTDKSYLEKLDLSEAARVNEQVTQIEKQGTTDVSSIFKNKIVARALEKGNQSLLNGFNEILPNIIPFSEHTFVHICPTCKCSKSPKLLLPYLERDLVIPVLGIPYPSYPTNFAETILSFPHISFHEYTEARKTVLKQRKEKLMSVSEVSSSERKCRSYVNSQFKNKTENRWWNEEIETFFANLEPYFYPDCNTINRLSEFLERKKFQKVDDTFKLGFLINMFRDSQAFSLVPQIGINQVDQLKMYSEFENGELNFDVTDIKSSIMSGLKLSYNPELPIDPI